MANLSLMLVCGLLRLGVIQIAPPGIEIPYDWFEFNADERGRFQLHLPSGQKFVLTAFVPDFFPIRTEPFVPNKPVNLTVKIEASQPNHHRHCR
jgi:hypothetical protein